jgi:1,4-alpha-glucan branching enzyme
LAIRGWSQNGLGGIYFYNDSWKANSPWGDTRFDYGRGEVCSFLKDQSVYFIEKFQADGLRYDATSFVRYYKDAYFNNHGANAEGLGLMQWINSEVHSKKPSAITMRRYG